MAAYWRVSLARILGLVLLLEVDLTHYAEVTRRDLHESVPDPYLHPLERPEEEVTQALFNQVIWNLDLHDRKTPVIIWSDSRQPRLLRQAIRLHGVKGQADRLCLLLAMEEVRLEHRDVSTNHEVLVGQQGVRR